MAQWLLLKEVNKTLTSYYNYDEYYEINSINKVINDLLRIYKKFDKCGHTAKIEFHCKKCQKQGKPSLLKVIKKRLYCEIRYCSNPYCINERFARQINEFNNIKRLKNLKLLWHFVIGFEPITIEEFKNDFTKIRKRYEYILNNFWSKIKKEGLNIQALRVMDFSFETDGRVYIHYHFGAIPWKNQKRRTNMKELKKIENLMNKNMKIKTPFFFKSFGYRKKESIFAYLSKRTVGLYKHGVGKNLDWNTGKGRLIKDIKQNKYFMLKDFINLIDYYDHFYNVRHYAVVGNLPQGSILTDSIINDYPKNCEFHGNLEYKDIFVQIIDLEDLAPT